MSDDDPFGEDFGSLEDFMSGLKPGESRPLSGILRYRQGNDPLDWSTGGASKYIPGSWQMLAGSIMWEGAADVFGGVEFNFASRFVNNPLVIATPTYTWPLFTWVSCMPAISSPYALTIYWWSKTNITQVMFNWLAMGPVGA